MLISSCSAVSKSQRQTLTQIPNELLGEFADDYGSSYTISKQVWMHGKKAKYHLLLYNRDENYLIAKNDKANPSDGGLYTRIDITYFKDMDPWQWGYCLTAYQATSPEAAMQTAAADRKNPRKGCNGFPFSRMKRK